MNLTDGNAHRITLYLLDWDTTARNETVTILDANSDAVLSTETFSSFHNGAYAVWNVKGHVQIQVLANHLNAVVAGVFFDPPLVASSTYLGMDLSTQGTWTGVYGSKGEIIANDVTNAPAFATVTLTGDTATTWVASTTDVRALQTASGSSTRFASAFYSTTSFTIDLNLTDGFTHEISLYLLDWGGSTRASETISILDAGSKAVLSTTNFLNITNGKYGKWDVKGHVSSQVTGTAGYWALVSGIFFD